jgi:carboxyl-terminal processing protease
VPSDEVTTACLKFAAVYGVLQENFMAPVEPDRSIFDGGIRGMLATLDPFSAFLDREQFELLKEQTRGEAMGFGSVLYVTPGKLVVLQTAQGSPSWRAGLGPGDEIVAINGTRVAQLDFQALVQLLQRARGHPVRLGVIHPGKLISDDLDLKPAEVAMPTVDKVFLLSPGLGYVHLSGFEQKTPQEVVNAVGSLNAPPLRGLLLDLRDNHGGMVDAAVAVASLFLKPDLLVLTTRGRVMPEKAYRTFPTPKHFDMPLIVLVNGNTASAAEVLAAALQEHDRGVIAGQPTFGKGLVQSVAELSDKTGLALTTGQYLTPSGRSIQRPIPGTALAALSEVPSHSPSAGGFHTDNGRPVSAGGGITPDVSVPPPNVDPWLAFLNQAGTFTNFALDYLSRRGKVSDSFEPSTAVLKEFVDYLTQHGIRVPGEYWDHDQEQVKQRIKVELFDLVFGLVRGDEVEVNSDPQVRKAASLFPRVTEILKRR